MASPEIEAVLREGIAGLAAMTSQTLRSAGGQGLNRLFRDSADSLVRASDTLRLSHTNSYLAEMWQRIGKNAQRSMVQSFGQLVTAREGPASASHYRAGEGRLANGILLRALGRSDFFTATSDGLDFGNRAMLDSEAKHWHRVNFGAAGRGQGSTKQFNINFAGAVSGSIGFDEGPSPAFSLPAGVWIGANGQRVKSGSSPNGTDMFFPQRKVLLDAGGAKVGTVNVRPKGILGAPNRLRPSRGIRGKNFMDAGLRRIASDVPEAFNDFLDTFLEPWQDGSAFT